MQAGKLHTRDSESPLPDWMAEAPVPASARKGSAISLSSSSDDDLARPISTAGVDRAADPAVQSAEGTPGLDLRFNQSGAHSIGEEREESLGADAGAALPAPFASDPPKQKGPSKASPEATRRKGMGQRAGKAGGTQAATPGAIGEAGSSQKSAALASPKAPARPKGASPRGGKAARDKAKAVAEAAAERARTSVMAEAGQATVPVLTTAESNSPPGAPTQGGACGDRTADAGEVPCRAQSGGASTAAKAAAWAPAGELALVMPEKLPMKVRSLVILAARRMRRRQLGQCCWDQGAHNLVASADLMEAARTPGNIGESSCEQQG